jgi:hypothetical protein
MVRVHPFDELTRTQKMRTNSSSSTISTNRYRKMPSSSRRMSTLKTNCRHRQGAQNQHRSRRTKPPLQPPCLETSTVSSRRNLTK